MRKAQLALRVLIAGAIAGSFGCGSSGGSSSKSSSASTANDPNMSGTFTTVGSLATGRRGHTATWVPALGKVLVAGGIGRSGAQDVVLDSGELFDPTTGRFSPAANRITGSGVAGQPGRAFHAAVPLQTGQVLLIGGQSDAWGAQPLATIEVIEPVQYVTSQFITVSGALSEAKAEPTVFSYPTASGYTEIVIAGGRTMNGTTPVPLGSVNFFSTQTNSIEAATAQLPQTSFGARALPILNAADAQWVLAGGITGSSVQASQGLAGFTIYDPTTHAFRNENVIAPTAANSALPLPVTGCDAALVGGSQITLFGGRNLVPESAIVNNVFTYPVQSEIEVYNPATNSWGVAASRLTTAREGHSATLLPNGDVLVIGGTDVNGQVLGTAEVISGMGAGPAVVRLTAKLQVARTGHTATLLPMVVGGQSVQAVLVVGGKDATGAPVSTAELFVPGGVVAAGVVAPGISGQAAPDITGLVPTQGPIGTAVTIQGAGFGANPGDNVVTFDGIVAPVQSVTAQGLTVLVPQGATTGEVVVTLGGIASNGSAFTVTAGTASSTGLFGTSTVPGAPSIFLVLPSSGSALSPFGIGGSGFDSGTIPFVNGVPSTAIFNFQIQNIPLLGSISLGFTVVPPGAPRGAGSVSVEYNGLMSAPYPFTVN